MSLRDTGLWALLALLWGTSFLAIDIGVDSLSPGLLVAGRLVIGAVLLMGVLWWQGGALRLGRRGWMIALIVGLSGNVLPFLLISFAEQRVDSGLAALIMAIAPIVTLVVAPFVHAAETLSRSKIIGGLIGFAGILVLVGPGALDGLGADLVAQLALIAAALFYAFTALFTRRFPHDDPVQMAAASVLVGAVLMTGGLMTGGLMTGGLLVGGTTIPATITAHSLLAVVYLGVGPTALAALVYFYLIPRIGAGRLQQINYVVPVLGTLLGVFILGERPDWNVWLAIPIILAAVFVVTFQPKKR